MCVWGSPKFFSSFIVVRSSRFACAFEPKEKRPLRVFGGGGGVFCRWLCVLSLSPRVCPKDREGGKSLVFSSSRDIRDDREVFYVPFRL